MTLASCGGSSSGSSGSGGEAKPYLFITDLNVSGVGYIYSFPLGSTGTVSASSQVTAQAGYTFRQVRGDGIGNIYVLTAPNAGSADVTVEEYSASNGVLTLKRSFTSTLASGSEALAVDRSGTVYVSESNGGVAVFASSASGTATPTVPVSFLDVANAMTTDASGNIYVLTAGNGGVYEYPSKFSGTALKALDPGAYISDYLTDIAVDSKGDIYVCGTTSTIGMIVVYDGGSLTPTRTISGSLTTLVFPPTAIAVDSSDNLHVNNYSSSYLTFASGASGNIAPTSVFHSSESNEAGLYAGLAIY